MWKYEHTITTKASVASIWKLYSDVSSWPTWDKGLEKTELFGPFIKGTKGSLTPTGQEALSFEILEVSPQKSYSDETTLSEMGITLRFSHNLGTSEDGLTQITHTVTISGPSADTLGVQIGNELANGIPGTMSSLADHALLLDKKLTR